MSHALTNHCRSRACRPTRQFNIWVSPKALVLLIALAFLWTATAADLSKVVIIKADDFTGTNQAWSNFLEASRAAGVKVSIGVITRSMRENLPVQDWMRAQENKGDVEFWNHGWDHKRWSTNDFSISEFQGSGLVNQREHLIRSQAALKKLLGHDVITLGTPYNGFDSETAQAMNESPALRLFFTYTTNPKTEAVRQRVDTRIALLDIVNEAEGTGKPNAARLAALLANRPPGPVSLQFHPPYFDAPHLDEYRKILADLKVYGYATMLPSEYVAALAAKAERLLTAPNQSRTNNRSGAERFKLSNHP
ncbi:MAG: polysaccharide deacetylase family protein [Verrucomicrobiota bacterium]